MQDWTNEELEQALLQVAQRATADPEFRALAIRDAGAAISRVSSKSLPKDKRYKFVNDSGHLKAIPDPVASCDEELDASELEAVSGGTGNPPPPVTGG